MNDNDVLEMAQACDSISEEICDAANFFAAEGASGAAFHRHATKAYRALHDAFMRIGADSASTGDVTPEAIREVVLSALHEYRKALVALNDDLRAVSKKLP